MYLYCKVFLLRFYSLVKIAYIIAGIKIFIKNVDDIQGASVFKRKYKYGFNFIF